MISFSTEEISFSLKQKTKLKTWITETVAKRKGAVGDLSFVFCSDEFLLRMNQDYLKHDTYTDIITFDYTQGHGEQRIVSGDIFISIDRVKENSAIFSKTFEEELHRVIIHGVLHLIGYKDKTKAAKEEMRKQEDLCLKAFQKT